MFKLRDYQEECHKDIMAYLSGPQSSKPGLVVLPTGTGKSISIAHLADSFQEGKILVLCPSKEILEQNFNKYKAYGGEACIYSASFASKEMCHVTFATLGSIKNLGKTFKSHGIKLLAMDEAHLNSNPEGGMFKKFFKDLSPKYTLGFTATPFRLKSYSSFTDGNYSQLNLMNRTRPKFFSNIVHVTQIEYAVKNGYWAPIEFHNQVFDPLGLMLNSTGAEYTQESMERVIKKNNVNNRIYKLIKKLISEGRESILVFLDTVDNCYTMKKALGDYAEVVDAKTPKKERTRILEEFKTGKVKVVVNNSVLTTGFDFPALQVVIMGRPTNSLAVLYQIYGRAVRPYKDKVAHIYDFGGNLNKFGDIRTLNLEDIPSYGWGLFNGEERLLTGTPMNGGDVFKKELINMKFISSKNFSNSRSRVFEFGKYKGKPPFSVPHDYLVWASENARGLMGKALYDEIMLEIKKAHR